MHRKYSPLHNKWHKIVEGQIRHTMGRHPKWFVFKDETDKKTCINSLAKRIVGEIVADRALAVIPQEDVPTCVPEDKEGSGGGNLRSSRKGVATYCSFSFTKLIQKLFK